MGRKLSKKRPPIILETSTDEPNIRSADTVLWLWRVRRKNLQTPLSLDRVRLISDAIGDSSEIVVERIHLYWDGRSEEYILCGIVCDEKAVEESRSTHEDNGS